jgi:hypothetical protein
VPLRTRDAKKEPGGSPTLQKAGPRLKKTWKMMPRRCQKETRRQKWPRKMTRRSKNTPEHHNRAAGALKAQTAHTKKHKLGKRTIPKQKKQEKSHFERSWTFRVELSPRRGLNFLKNVYFRKKRKSNKEYS